MSGLRVPGIGSGLDINGIVSQLMALEQRPLRNIQSRQNQVTAQISGYGALRASVSNLQSAMDSLADIERFQVFRAEVSNPKVLNVSATSAATRGNYSLEVVRLAENHRMASATALAADATLGAEGETLQISVGGSSISVAAGGRTLAQIRDAINAASGSLDVTASIVREDAGSRLLLSSSRTGAAGFITTQWSGATDPLGLASRNADRDASGTFTASDLDARVVVEGAYTVTSSSNVLSDTIDGVSLTLLEPGTTRVNISRDVGQVQSSIQQFVRAYNDLVGNIGKLGGEALRADRGLLSSVTARMRAVMNDPSDLSSSFRLPFEIGIATTRAGTLEVNTTTLSRALERDFTGVASMFADPENGLAVRMKALAESLLDVGGLVTGRTESLERERRSLEGRAIDVQRRLATKQEALIAQFSSLEATLVRMQGTSSALSGALAQLEGISRQRG
jgi:flagellar hook-associated protein 2